MTSNLITARQTASHTEKKSLLTCKYGVVLILTAIGEQFIFISVDGLYDIHGKLRESDHKS